MIALKDPFRSLPPPPAALLAPKSDGYIRYVNVGVDYKPGADIYHLKVCIRFRTGVDIHKVEVGPQI